jgi:sugar/nucleoside kinase (ribokinase family)
VVEAVETTGCGDVLAAATVMGLKEGQPIKKALQWGMELAAIAAQVKGVVATFQSLKTRKASLI